MTAPTKSSPRRDGAAERGAALALFVHVLLLLLVLGQVVYLASRYRLRVDMTSDRLWTSTESTRRLLEKLDKRLVIEAYFSPKEDLPVNFRGTREWADNFLDEVEQVGAGKVVVQRYDPNSDKAVADKATRLGVEPLRLQSQSTTSLSIDQHWQGLRLVYGGGKQEVIASFLPASSFAAEALVTPRIKEVLTEKRQRFGYMEWPARAAGQRAQGVGWNLVRTQKELEKRYEFQNFKDEDGALLPSDVETLFLFRPKDLTDRQKYVLDQFLMSGGTLVVFADAAEYAIGPQRLMMKMPLLLDANGSELAFVDQLRHYGVDWQPKVLADMQQQAHAARTAQEYYSVPIRTTAGVSSYHVIGYPYFFHAMAVDWARLADQLATDVTGKVDARKAEQYRATLKPGMPTDDFLFQAFKQRARRGPGFYWPTWVDLRRKAGGVEDLPADVTGRVMLWSSPLVLVDDPPQTLDPVGRDPSQWGAHHQQFLAERNERVAAEARRQAPLMVELTGKFTSFFRGKDRPLRPSEKEEAARGGDDQGGDEPQPEAPVEPDPDQGPQPAEPAAPSAGPQEPAMVTAAARPGRIVVVGDATFLRDDLLRGDYAQAGGPASGIMAMPFFAQLLDWLSGDRDLVALQSRLPTDRTLQLVAPDDRPGRDPRDAEQAVRSKTRALVWANVAAPCALLAGFGAVLWTIRRRQKRTFLQSLT